MRKLIIGITGTFGSGKSTVSAMLKTRNVCVIDADRLAKRVSERKAVKRRIMKEFGTACRKCLSEIVFSDRAQLKKLSKIIHPALKREIKRIISGTGKIVIIDAPLIVEAGFTDIPDILALVTCRPETRKARLLKKGYSEQEIISRTMFQMPDREKARHADYAIDNSGGIRETRRQAEKLWKLITSRR